MTTQVIQPKQTMRDRRLYLLIYIPTLMALGHHIDHIIRGTHVGWPITAEVTPFTLSLAIYPVILLGLFLYRAGKAGPGFWVFLSGGGAIFVTAIHFGPTSVEQPHDIINAYEPQIIGWLAFAWLLLFIVALASASLYEGYSWLRQRRDGRAW
jgi:hypothetical protein